MRPSVILFASVIGLAAAQSPDDCIDPKAASDCVLDLADAEASCQTVLAIKQCYVDYCPDLSLPDQLNSIINTCENGGTFPGFGSDTDGETPTQTGSGSESTSTSGSGSGSGSSEDSCSDTEAYKDCVSPLAKLEQTCDVILEAAECFANFCPERAFQIEEDVAACSASGSGTGSGSGSTRTSSAVDSDTTGFESGIPGSGSSSTPTTSGADSTGTGTGSDSDSDSDNNSTDPTNTSSNGDGPVATDTEANEGAADRLFAPVGAIIGSIVAVMAWL
ncbi:hypothetical protein V496_09104 [Pseudogymnoascus sp. VKM F-4515 (FW-2607)]|nr:hypothetical protein V496_09104 [Pseudogymnoascus sp. VKM F-4515 (FW-2607)]KFY98691.1 hypothetical protein V498_01299 [Pseudogymnoascus sp. VKM F-4517 (FW-2822)]